MDSKSLGSLNSTCSEGCGLQIRLSAHAHTFSGNMGVSSFNNIEEQPRLSELRYRLGILKHHDIYPFLIIIEYSHADPNNYSQPMHNNIIIVVHNYIVVN